MFNWIKKEKCNKHLKDKVILHTYIYTLNNNNDDDDTKNM